MLLYRPGGHNNVVDDQVGRGQGPGSPPLLRGHIAVGCLAGPRSGCRHDCNPRRSLVPDNGRCQPSFTECHNPEVLFLKSEMAHSLPTSVFAFGSFRANSALEINPFHLRVYEII
ncbi:hypothetical protein F2P81_025943 [Scophthalmus maximus]|uniref:Uncharacterized protein n=1 Tax=Scophthalmus maximus TaxID=52904 RepID=A0A6A4RT70_SCOMX|nr:hypothetical protein F2P81_025943 [Scophthalmus maximus]